MAVKVPFRLAGGAQPLILVEARANGIGPFPFILDTGAGMCLLSPDLARWAGVAETGQRTAVGAAGHLRVGLGRLGRLSVGEAEVPDVAVAITEELEGIGEAVGARIFGDVGYGFLKHFEVTIDYARSRLIFACPSEASEDREDPEAIPFEIGDERRPLVVLPVEVNGEGPFRFALDTAASTTVLSLEVKKLVGVAGERALAMAGGGGKVGGLSGSVESIRVGARSSGPHEVVVGPFLAPLSEAIGERLDGILGYNFLRRFRIRIDYPGRRLRLCRPGSGLRLARPGAGRGPGPIGN